MGCHSDVVCVFTNASRQQYMEAASQLQVMQQQNNITISQLHKQTAQLMAVVLNTSDSFQSHADRVAYIQESELWDKVQAKHQENPP